jgi:hypothetical protein
MNTSENEEASMAKAKRAFISPYQTQNPYYICMGEWGNSVQITMLK